jgi:spore germination protein
LFPVAALLFLGAIFWGYQEHQEKNSILIKAENGYQRAFHDLSHHMNRLQDELGQTLAVSSTSYGAQRKGLANVWRLTSQAQNEINQLPLTMLPFSHAESFLARINDFAYKASIRDLNKQPLTASELKTLKTLHASSADINKELGKIQDAVIQNRLRWMDVETALASEHNPHDNTIIDGFRTIDKKIGEYPEADWGPSAMSQPRKFSAAALDGNTASPAEIRAKAESFLGYRELGAGQMTVSETGGKSSFKAYTVTVPTSGGHRVQLEYTQKGGHLLWYMNTRPVHTRKLNFDTARNKAGNFLVRNQYRNMTPVSYDEYDHVAVFTFAAVKNGVRMYNDKVTVRVALDNGDIVGLQATDHVFADKVLTPGRPKMSREEALKRLNPDFRVLEHNLAVVENDSRQPVLTHEFVGTINGGTYRIYLNADTGLEESIEKVPDSVKPLYQT